MGFPRVTNGNTADAVFRDGTTQVWQFPNELGTKRYPHFAMFYILASTKATAGTSTASKEAAASGGQNTAGTSASTIARKTLGSLAVQYKRTTHAVALYMPPQIKTSYAMNYVEGSTGKLGGAILGSLQALSQGNLGGAALESAIGAAALAGRSSIEKLASAGGVNNAAEILGGITGKVDNPRTETLFKSTNIRSHQFDFVFWPKDESESMVIADIIDLFKINMHPELSTNTKPAATAKPAAKSSVATDIEGTFLLSPNQFDIEFYGPANGGTSQNVMVHKITTCVLESMSVDYSGTGQWLAFADTQNPVNIHLSLSFKELEPLYRKQVMEGY